MVVNSACRSGLLASAGLSVLACQDFSSGEGWRGLACGPTAGFLVFVWSLIPNVARSSGLHFDAKIDPITISYARGKRTPGQPERRGRLRMTSQKPRSKTVAAINTKITCLARFCCFETSVKFSGNGKSGSRRTFLGRPGVGWGMVGADAEPVNSSLARQLIR